MHAGTAPRMPPTSRTTIHDTHSTRVVGKRSGQKNCYGKNPPRLPAHRSGPGPTMCRAYVWPRPGGSCRCTKVGALLLTPLLVHGQSEPRPRPHLAGQGREAGEKPKPKTNKAMPRPETPKSKRARWTPPARPLPGQLPRCQQSEPPLSPRVPTQPTTLEPRLGRRLCGGMQIFIKIINI